MTQRRQRPQRRLRSPPEGLQRGFKDFQRFERSVYIKIKGKTDSKLWAYKKKDFWRGQPKVLLVQKCLFDVSSFSTSCIKQLSNAITLRPVLRYLEVVCPHLENGKWEFRPPFSLKRAQLNFGKCIHRPHFKICQWICVCRQKKVIPCTNTA